MKTVLSTLLAAVCILSSQSLSAAEPAGSDAKLAEMVKVPHGFLAEIIQSVSRGEIEEAWGKYAEHLVDAPQEAGEFESEFRTSFRRLFKQFPKGAKSLDLVAVRTLSTSSYRMTCVANCRQGPVVVESVAYQYDGKWWFCQIGFQPVHAMDANRLKAFVDVLPAERIVSPLSLSISPEPVNRISENSK